VDAARQALLVQLRRALSHHPGHCHLDVIAADMATVTAVLTRC
jgi:hypothetical protein